MHLTTEGHKILKGMVKQYGSKKAMEVFYASIKSGKPGSGKWYKDGPKRTTQKKNRYTSALGGPDMGNGDP